MPRFLFVLALGSFAIGTDAFVIAGILPDVAASLSVTVRDAGLLVSGFALVYALGGPILAVVSAPASRRVVLATSLLVFTAANILAAAAPAYGWLMGARMLAAVSAGLYVPSASAVAAAAVGPAARGRALAVVVAGTTLATAFGVPLGAAVGAEHGWRATFALVAALGVVAALGLLRLPPLSAPRVPSLRTRLQVARRRAILPTLGITAAAMTGAFAVYTYIGSVLGQAAGVSPGSLSALLLVWGLAAALGNWLGGQLTDRIGSAAVMVVALAGLTAEFGVLAAHGPRGTAAAAAWLAAWGITGWMFLPAIQHRLVEAAPDAGAVVLSLNASAIYLGVALGGALGGPVLDAGGPAWLGVAAVVCTGIACALLARTREAITPSPAGESLTSARRAS